MTLRVPRALWSCYDAIRAANGLEFGARIRGRRVPCYQSISQRRSEEHTSELQSQSNLVCRLLLEKKKKKPLNIHEHINTQTSSTAGTAVSRRPACDSAMRWSTV